MAFGAKLTAASDYLFRRLFKFLFRYDIFLSYARRDGKDYAYKLKEQLTRLDFACFLDHDEMPPGNSLNRTLRRAIKRSAALIVVGTEGALRSRYVELEVAEFAETGRAVIPINFEGTMEDAPWPVIKERDLIWVDETRDALAKNSPSPQVADAVDKLFKYTRRNVRVRGQIIATAALFVVGAAVSAFVIQRQVAAAGVQRRAAEAATARALQEQARAEAAADRAKQQEEVATANALKAQQMEQEAKKQAEEARTQGELAKKQTAEARKQANIARVKAEEARRQQLLAEQQQRLAASRGLAANAVSQLQIDPELSLVLAARSAESVRTTEGEDALRRALLESHVRAVAEGHRGEVTRASFTPDGGFVVAAGDDNAARVLRLSDGRVVAELRGHAKPLRGAAFSPDGALVVTAGDDKAARVWDRRANRVLLELPHPDAVSGARFSPDGAAVITTCDDNAARVWDAKTGRRLSPTLYGIVAKEYRGTKQVVIRPFSPDGRHVFFVPLRDEEHRPEEAEGLEKRPGERGETVYADGRASVWDVSAGRVVPGLEKLPHVLDADVSVEHKLLITLRGHPKGNGPAALWDLSTGRRFAVLPDSNRDVNAVALGPDGKLFVTAHGDGAARVWKVPEDRGVAEAGKEGAPKEAPELDKPLWVLSGHKGTLRSAAFSPDGRYILTASDDRTARVWDAKTGQEVTVLRGHRRGVLGAAFSPNGGRMVTSSEDGTARVWDAGMGQGFVELGREGAVQAAAFGSRSDLVAIVNKLGEVRVWDARAGISLAHMWRGHVAALGPDGRVIVTAEREGSRVYEARTGRVRSQLPALAGTVPGAAHYSPDGRFIAAVGAGGVVRLIEAETGKVFKELTAKGAAGLLFGPAGGDALLIKGADGAQVWEWKTERPPVVLPEFYQGQSGVAFSPDGRFVAGPGGAEVGLWDARTGCRVKTQPVLRGPLQSIVFGRDGRTLLSADVYEARLWQLPATLECESEGATLKGDPLVIDHDKTGGDVRPLREGFLSPDGAFIVLRGERGVSVHDARTGALKFKLDSDTTRAPAAALSSDGRLIVTAREDGRARVWDSATGKILRTLEGEPSVPLTGVSFSPDDQLIVTVSEGRFNLLTVWDAATGRRLAEDLRGQSASFSPDGKSVLALSGGDVARVSDVSTGHALFELQGLTGEVKRLAFSDDGLRVAAATSDNKVFVWDTASGLNPKWRGYEGEVEALAFVHGGKVFAAVVKSNWQRSAQVWDVAADKVKTVGKTDVAGVALSPDGRFLVTSEGAAVAGGGRAQVWDAAAGGEKKLAELEGHLAAFSPDGSRIATVSNNTARVWDTSNWGLVSELRGHAERITSVDFSPDGRLAVTTAWYENTALLWNAETGAVEARLFGDTNYGLSNAVFSPRGVSILVVGMDNAARLYTCEMCGGWDELLARARERFTRHPRQLTPEEQKKFTRLPLASGLANARDAGFAAP